MLRLDKRLSAVLDELTPCDCIIDVGCDHGKLTVASILSHKANRAIAADISKPSLAKAIELANSYGIGHLVSARRGNGLDVLTKDDVVDTCIICGMGGNEIIKILSASDYEFSKYILVPHRDSIKLRRFLISKPLCITKDYVVADKSHYYDVIVAVAGNSCLTEQEIEYGKDNLYPTLRADFIAKAHRDIDKYTRLYYQVTKEEDKAELQKKIFSLKELVD